MVWTNLGKEKMFEEFFCSGAIDDTFRLVLCTSAGSWNASTSHTSSLSAVSSLLPSVLLRGTCRPAQTAGVGCWSNRSA